MRRRVSEPPAAVDAPHPRKDEPRLLVVRWIAAHDAMEVLRTLVRAESGRGTPVLRLRRR